MRKEFLTLAVAGEGAEDVVRVLLEANAGINAQDATGETALHAAAGKRESVYMFVLCILNICREGFLSSWQ
jgi:ankyrin repeat protein